MFSQDSKLGRFMENADYGTKLLTSPLFLKKNKTYIVSKVCWKSSDDCFYTFPNF